MEIHMLEEKVLSEEITEERRALCVVCKSRLSKKIGNEMIWIGHYDTPEGIYCIECYPRIKIRPGYRS
jgi:hypothetical protein